MDNHRHAVGICSQFNLCMGQQKSCTSLLLLLHVAQSASIDTHISRAIKPGPAKSARLRGLETHLLDFHRCQELIKLHTATYVV